MDIKFLLWLYEQLTHDEDQLLRLLSEYSKGKTLRKLRIDYTDGTDMVIKMGKEK